MTVNYALKKNGSTANPACVGLDKTALTLKLYADGKAETNDAAAEEIETLTIEFNHDGSGKYDPNDTFTLTLLDPDGKAVSPIRVHTLSGDEARLELSRDGQAIPPSYKLYFTIPGASASTSETSLDLHYTGGTPPPKLEIIVKRKPSFSWPNASPC